MPAMNEIETKKRNQAEARKVLAQNYKWRGCVVCGLELDVLIAAHLDQQNWNNAPDNLAWMCGTHHDMYDRGLYPSEAIKLLRAHWEKTLAQTDNTERMKDAGPRAAATRLSNRDRNRRAADPNHRSLFDMTEDPDDAC
jgi:hypothetical protein